MSLIAYINIQLNVNFLILKIRRYDNSAEIAAVSKNKGGQQDVKKGENVFASITQGSTKWHRIAGKPSGRPYVSNWN